MSTTSVAQPPAASRWAVAVAFLALCAALASALAGSGGPRPADVQALALPLIALSAYASVLYPLAGGLACGLAALLALAWAWAVLRAPLLGWHLAALAVLLAAAAGQRRLRSRRLTRMSQLLEDLREERTVKAQAVAAAGQTQEALQRKLSRYLQLQTIAEELSRLMDLTAVAQLAVERAFSLIGKSDACLLFLVDPERQELSLFASKKREAVPAIRAKHGDQFDRHVLRAHRPLLVNDARRDFRFTAPVGQERAVSSVIACPLLIGQAPAGVLRLDSAKSAAYTQDDLRFLDILLDLLSAAVTNARLFAQIQQLATTDGLTGLMLRRPFLEELARELTRAARRREPASVLVIDVDRFKDYNDTFGHTAGDLVLKAVAETLRAVAPPDAVVGRYGGEEFVVLLPRASRPQASDVAERIRKTVEQGVSPPAPRPPAGQTADSSSTVRLRRTEAGGGMTVSVGVASFPDDAQAELELIRVADQRLYQAKHAGRNLVVSS
jgi:diguanylate cyclase (GGDEF)-like protein